MARKPLVYIPGIPSHIVQRGVDRSATFFSDDDYRFYDMGKHLIFHYAAYN